MAVITVAMYTASLHPNNTLLLPTDIRSENKTRVLHLARMPTYAWESVATQMNITAEQT